MKRNTPKRAKADRDAAPDRKRFAEQHPFCWFCGSTWDLAVDEIVSGMSFRCQGVKVRLAWTRACNTCNEGPLASSCEEVVLLKLAMKFTYDREYLDVAEVCRMRGRAPTAITLAEVERAAKVCQTLMSLVRAAR